MANSSRKKILDDLVTTLGTIATGSGYNFTIGQAARGHRHFNSLAQDIYTAAFVAGADETRRNSAQREFTSDIRASIVAWVRHTDSHDKAGLEQALDNLIEDITKAVMVDVTRGGNAITTEITDIDTDKGAFQPWAGAEIVVKVTHRASVSSP